MRIAWISYTFGEYSVEHLNAMADQHQLLLVMPRAVLEQQPIRLDPRVQTCLFQAPRLRQALRQFCSTRALRRAIRDFDPDVVHLQHGHLYFNLGLPGLRRFPLVVTIHDPRHHAGDRQSRKTPQWVMDFGFKRATRVIVHGRQLADAVSHEIGIPSDRIHVIPHIAIGKSGSDPPAEKLFELEEPETILFFGRIWQYKGLEYLISAQPWIAEHCPRLKVIIAGEGEDLDRYRRLISDPSSFEIINRWIGDDERAQLFRRAALVVLPYIEATQSGVVPVAYSFARPVVATRVGALAESVEHEHTGLLVPPRDARALAEAIVALLRDPARRRALGQAGQLKQQRESAPAIVARQTLAVYEQAVCDRRGSQVPVSALADPQRTVGSEPYRSLPR
jgi:glycosyltransferase involved in cell wall biosynthesis